MSEIKHRMVETNGIHMHIAESGAGPPVVLCHGFPESWYSWRHQLHALAEAGLHGIAPDMRGYGQTDRPEQLRWLNRDCGPAPVGLVGHWWGGAVITEAGNDPQVARR